MTVGVVVLSEVVISIWVAQLGVTPWVMKALGALKDAHGVEMMHWLYESRLVFEAVKVGDWVSWGWAEVVVSL